MKKIPHGFRMIAGCALLLAAPQMFSQDWPQWLGPARDGKASGFKAPAAWPKELKQQWKVTVGDGVATPALVGDRLYVFARQEGSEILRCLDAKTGQEHWRDQYESLGASGPASGFAGPRSTPTVADGKVVVQGVRGVLSCYDAQSGKLLWRKDEVQGYPQFFVSSSPLLVEGLCIAQVGGRNNGSLIAYELSSGTEKWRVAGDSPAYASPALLTIGASKLIVAETERRIVVVNAADGSLVWETPYSPTGRGYNASTPIVDGQTLIFAGSGRGTRALKFEKQGDQIQTRELWSNAEKSVMYNTPTLKGDYVYGLTPNNEFFCLNAKDGQTAWSAPFPTGDSEAAGGRGGRGGRGGFGGGGYGSIVDAGAALAALTPSAQLVFFEPNGTQFKQVASYKVSESPTYAFPVLSGNRIFIKDRDSVILWTLP